MTRVWPQAAAAERRGSPDSAGEQTEQKAASGGGGGGGGDRPAAARGHRARDRLVILQAFDCRHTRAGEGQMGHAEGDWGAF